MKRNGNAVGVAILGCGFVADFYMATVPNYCDMQVVGAYDIRPERLGAFSKTHGVRQFRTIDAMLEDDSVDIVLNLTHPRAHFDLTKRCLEAGKHVYSEKPLAMNAEGADELVRLASARGLVLASAPCSLLGETAQTMWQALDEGAVGRVRLVYANFDDGMVHRLDHRGWRSKSGAQWPGRDEFETGCTYEHAGYVLSWLAFFFGPARRVHAYASCQIPDKGIPVSSMAPDFSTGCIEYDNSIVARVTCSIIAPNDKSLMVIGDDGVLYTKDVRNDAAPVYIRGGSSNRIVSSIISRWRNWQSQVAYILGFPYSFGEWAIERKYPFATRPKFRNSAVGKPVDFMRGPAEMVRSMRENRPCRLSPELGLHMVELIEALQYPQGTRTISSTFEPIVPLRQASAYERTITASSFESGRRFP